VKPGLDFPELFPEVLLIQDGDLRAQVEAVWQELWQMSDFSSIDQLATSPEIHYLHVPHNRAVVEMALAVATTFERFHTVKVDRDVLVAAALLQDASKLIEYTLAGGKVELSTLGRDYPHAFWGAHTALKHGVPAGHELKLGSYRQHALQGLDTNPQSVSCDLHHRAVRTSIQAYGCRYSHQPFVPNHSDFYGLSFLHRYHQRNQATVRKVQILNPLARFVQAGVMLQVNRTQ
jgi:hypothetical protein